MLECRQINYNWRMVGDHRADDGQEFDVYLVGHNRVVKIVNMTPTESYSGPEFYDVTFDNGTVITTYNVNQAFYYTVEEK